MKRTRPFVWEKVRPKPDKTNKEGFPAFSADLKTDLVNVLTTGTTANTFYVSKEDLVRDYAHVIGKAVKETPEFTAKATVYAREKGYKRELPVAATVALSTLKDKKLFRSVVHRVCRTPTDWQKLIDVARSGEFRNGCGRVIKESIIEAIADLTPYHAMKYPKACVDMINVAHPHESINPAVIRYLKRKDHTGDEQFQALYRLKHTEDDGEAARIIEEARLPFEVVTGCTKMTPRVWEALLRVAPYFNLIRNLRNFFEKGVFDKEENVEFAVNKITNPEAVRESKLFPFRFYVAYRMLESVSHGYEPTVKKALEEAAELSIANVPDLEGKVAIATDVSGSMESSLTGDYSVVECCDVAGLFSATLIKKCRKLPVVLPFDYHVRFDVVERAMTKETLFEVAKALAVADGGTSLSAPVEYLLEERIDVDTFVAITDNEEWVSRSFQEALHDYVNRVNPEVKVYLITLLPYRDYPVPPSRNVHYVFGWSDHVLNYVTTDASKQIEEIDSVGLY